MSGVEQALNSPSKGLVGPTFFWELIQQSRKGRGYFARFSYAITLLCMLYVIYPHEQFLSQKLIAQVSETTTNAYLVLQLVAVLVLTPIFTADCFVEERQKRTLELIFTTFVTPRELILGKLVSRLMQVLAVLLAGLPVLAILQLFGGVNFQTVLWSTALTILIMLVCGMYAIRALTLSARTSGTIVLTYAMMFTGFIITLPIGLLSLSSIFNQGVWLTLFWGVLINLLFGAISIGRAIREIQKAPELIVAFPQGSLPPVTIHSQIVLQKRFPWIALSDDDIGTLSPTSACTIEAERRLRVPPVNRWPLAWKEMYFPTSTPIALLALLLCGLPFMIFGLLGLLHSYYYPTELLVFKFAKLNMLILLALVTFRAAVTFSQERLQRTIELVLASPMSHSQMLLQKGIGSLLRYRTYLAWIALILLIHWMYQPLLFAPMVLLFMAQLTLGLSFGLFLSLQSVSSFMGKLLIGFYYLSAYFFLPSVLAVTPYHSQSVLSQTLNSMVSPYSVWSLCDSDPELEVMRLNTFQALLGGSIGFLLLRTAMFMLLFSGFLVLLCKKSLRRWQQHLK